MMFTPRACVNTNGKMLDRPAQTAMSIITAYICQTRSLSMALIGRLPRTCAPPPSGPRIYLHPRTHMPYIQAIIIYLFGHLLLIPTSICFRAKALLGVINLVSVSPYRAACPPACLPAASGVAFVAFWIDRPTGFPNPEAGRP